MVSRSRFSRRRFLVRGFAPTLTVLALVNLPSSGMAQSVTEQMGNEVAAIYRQVNGSVVSIEDLPLSNTVADSEKDVTAALEQRVTARRAASEARQHIAQIGRQISEAKDSATRKRLLQEMAREAAMLSRLAQGMVERGYSTLTEVQGMSSEISQYLMLAKTLVSTPKSGSGFCIEGGFVLTTADVLEGMQNPFVTTRNGTRIKAMIVGMDIEINIGILRVPEESGLPALRFGDSTSVQPGNFALCIGNQNGLINSLSPLNVSGIREEGTYSGVHVYPSLIQVAGTVGAGSSGSPLLNMRGEVIGMMAAVPGPDATEMRLTTPPVAPALPRGDTQRPSDTRTPETPRRRDTRPDGDPTARSGTNSRIAIIKTNVQIPESARSFLPQEFPGTTGSAGDVQAQGNVITIRSSFSSAGFAIPMHEMKATIDVLKTGKPIVRGWLGVNVDDDEKVVRSGQMVKIEPRVRIVRVIADSPAAAAGLKTGDSLVVLNGTPIHCTACVRAATIRARIGDTIQAVVERGGKTLEIPLKIEAKPNNVKLGVIKP